MSNPSCFAASNYSGSFGALCGLALSCCIQIVLHPKVGHLAMIVANSVFISMCFMVFLVILYFAFNSKGPLSLLLLLL